jgi:hypothetical protein
MKTFALLIACIFTSGALLGQQAMFPLQVGNRWQLGQFSPGYPTVYWNITVVQDTLMPNGKTYSVLESFSPRFLRSEGNRLFTYSPTDSVETGFYDFAANMGDTVGRYFSQNDTFTVILVDSGQASLFDEMRRTWEFLSVASHSIDADGTWTIVDSIGFYYFNSMWGPYYFAGAVLNGRTYGSIVLVENPPSSIPAKPSLEQNYPNPFNPTTRIAFTIPYKTHAKLEVLDLLGRVISTAFDGDVDPGNHVVDFDATRLSTGLYFYSLTAGEQRLTKAMIFCK